MKGSFAFFAVLGAILLRGALAGGPTAQPLRPAAPPPTLSAASASDATLLRKAEEFFERGEWREAERVYGQIAQRHLGGKEAPQALLQKAVCEERQSKWDEARETYQNILLFHPKHPSAAKAQAGIAGLLWRRETERARAIAEYEKLIKEYPAAAESAAALKVLGDWFYGQKDYAHARSYYQTYLTRFAGAADGKEIAEKVAALQMATEGKQRLDASAGFSEAVDTADALHKRGRYAEALSLYDGLLRRFGGSPEASSRCRMQMGVCRLGLRQYAAAVHDFEMVATRYPQSQEAPEAYWRCAQLSYCFLQQPHEVRKIALTLAQGYRDTFQAQKANFLEGMVVEAQGPPTRVRSYWKEFLGQWPETPYRETIEDKLDKLSSKPKSKAAKKDKK